MAISQSLHWLKINEHVKHKLLSLTYKFLTTHQPQYLHDSISVQPCQNTRSISVQPCQNTRSSSMVTLARPPTRSSLKITNRSFRYAAPCLWNELSTDLREPRQTVSCSFSYHTWQFIIFTIFIITACIISYSLRISLTLALQQILSSIDLFLFYRTDYTDSRTMLNGCTGKCVRLSRPLVGFRTHYKSLHFHSFIQYSGVSLPS